MDEEMKRLEEIARQQRSFTSRALHDMTRSLTFDYESISSTQILLVSFLTMEVFEVPKSESNSQSDYETIERVWASDAEHVKRIPYRL